MGLFDKLMGKAKTSGAPQASSAPEPVNAQTAQDVLCAPVSGRLVALETVPDPVFAQGMLGKGCAIWPDGHVVYAPAAGEVTVAMGHAMGLKTDDGIEVLVHVGVDTVGLQGEGFTAHVSQGDHVVAGQPLFSFDRKVIADAGYEDCVMLLVSNTAEFSDVIVTVDLESSVAAGDAVVKVVR